MILELGSSLEVVRVTAEYSNAVLVAVLPYISDVAQRLDLPVPHPVKPEYVFHCSIMPLRKWGVEVGVEGGWVFGFKEGYIDTIQGPHSYYILQDPDKIPKYYGEIKMSRAEAIQLARDTIRKLGIPLESVFAEQEPRVTEPVKIDTNTVPHYRIEWLDPRAGVVGSVDAEIDGNTRKLERIRFMNRSLERAPPKLSVEPQRDSRFPRRPLVNPEYAWRLIPFVLRAVDEYGRKLSLPIPRPLTTNHVARFFLGDNGGWPHSEIELTNGWRFVYRNNMVNGYYAPDNLFNSDNRPILIKEFVGKWNMTEPQAIELARRTLARLNYPTNLVHMDFPPRICEPALPGIPRLLLTWDCDNEAHDDLQSRVEAEVDADSGEIKSLYYDDKAYWNQPPPIDVPISLPSVSQANAVGSPPSGRPQSQPKPLPQYFKVLSNKPPQ